MATVYRTTVWQSSENVSLHRDTGETVVVEGDIFVRLAHGTMVPMDLRWQYDARSADLQALPDLERRAAELKSAIDSITKNRPLPAAAAAHGQAAGRAHAEVAT